jgi:hypothetical protein
MSGREREREESTKKREWINHFEEFEKMLKQQNQQVTRKMT